jgi:hypothetical protein
MARRLVFNCCPMSSMMLLSGCRGKDMDIS